MKTIYIDAKMGAAGDMLTAALVEISENLQETAKKLNLLQIPSVKFEITEKIDKNIVGSHSKVIINEHFEEECAPSGATTGEIEHQLLNYGCNNTKNSYNHSENIHNHLNCRHLSEIFDIIDSINASDKVKNDAKQVYSILAEAESEAHGMPVAEIHFHEVGMMDAIADITAVCYLFNELNADRVIVSPINLGNGKVKCSHGILDVPAPATANVIKNLNLPHYKDESGIMKELCTPTGAALLGYFANEFTFSSEKLLDLFSKNDFEKSYGKCKIERNSRITIKSGYSAVRVGHGMGTRVIEQAPNCVTAYLVEE